LNVLKVDRLLHLFSPPSVASSLPKPVRHPYDAAAGTFRIGGHRAPFPSCCSGDAGPACSTKRARRCTTQRGLTEGALLRWQRGEGMGCGGDRPRMGTSARMLALFLYAGAVLEVCPDTSWRRTFGR
jgi:hypothetical protein